MSRVLMRKFSFILIIISFNAFSSIDVINSTEMAELDSINTTLSNDDLLHNLGMKVSEYNKTINDYNIDKQKLLSIKKQYGYLLNNSSEFFKPEVLSNRLILLINDKNELEDRMKMKQNNNLNKEEELSKIREELKENKEKIHYELLRLKAKITERILNDVKDNQLINVKLSASIKCSRTQSLRQCLNGSKESILSGLRHSNVFLDETSIPSTYDILDASMSLDGTLNYTVSATFKPVYTDEVAAEINEQLGLVSTTITLYSNVPAQWFIDGSQSKSGENIKVDLTNGVHSIVASYKGVSQSIVRNINNEQELYFPFNSNEKDEQKKNDKIKPSNISASLPDTKLVKDIKNTIDELTKTSSREHNITFKVLNERSDELVAYEHNSVLNTDYSHALSLCENNDRTLIDTGKLLDLLNLRLIGGDLLKYPYMTFDESSVKLVQHSIVRSKSKKGIVICH